MVYRCSYHLFLLIPLCFLLLNDQGILADCSKKREMNIWSPSKCVAGRRFFARLDHIPLVFKSFSNKTIIQPYTFPWIAHIKVDVNNNHRKSCTGVLINDRYVLGSQHCVLPPIQAKHLTITMGYFNGYESEEPTFLQPRILERKVIKLILHPNFNVNDKTTASNDLALLKFNSIKYSKTIYPIQLPTYLDTLIKDHNGLVAENAGWDVNIGFGKYFKQIPMTIVDINKCKTHYNDLMVKDTLCFQPSLDYCLLENDGPLMVERARDVYNVTVLMGMVSWSSSKGECDRTPIVSVRIDSKLSWIKQNTKDAIYCQY